MHLLPRISYVIQSNSEIHIFELAEVLLYYLINIFSTYLIPDNYLVRPEIKAEFFLREISHFVRFDKMVKMIFIIVTREFNMFIAA